MIKKTIKGDLITLTLGGDFDLICHQVSCMSKQKAGIAVAMAKTFETNLFKYEIVDIGSINKLGTVDYGVYWKQNIKNGKCKCIGHHNGIYKKAELPLDVFYVANLYGQYLPATLGNYNPTDYAAIEICFKKLNVMFTGYHVGIPKIGAGLGGGDWNKIKEIINKVTPNLNITLVEL